MILVCWYKFVSLCLHGWVIVHFIHVVPRKKYENYERQNSYVGRWIPKRRFADAELFRGLLDSIEHCHVTWMSYEHQRDVTPFQDVCWYSGWIMAGKQKMVRHLPERVLRQYEMFRLFLDLLLRFCLLPQHMWLLPSWSLLCMSLLSSRGVTRSRTTSLGSIQIGTLGASTVYPILLLSTLLQSPSFQDVSTGYSCWPGVGQTSSRSIAGHQQHERQSGACDGDSTCGFKSTLFQHFGGPPGRV